MKEIVLDTETTGLNVRDGHRIVEIGCLELENLIPTKKKFQNIQLSLDYKKKKSRFIIKNDFTKKTVTKYVKHILTQIKK